MLDPKDSVAFTDILRPPPGFVLDAAVGTTFSLDFEAFTAVLLAFVGAELDDDKPDAASVLTAVARLRRRLCVFVNAGGFAPPRKPSPLLALYGRVVRSVAIKDAAFHPKVWALKFVPLSKPEMRRSQPIYRVVCASRNVTDSGCWELGARFDGAIGKGDGFGDEVAGFFRHLAKAHRPPAAVWRMLSELSGVAFERSAESDGSLRFLWQWPGRSGLAAHLPKAASRALFISPFLRSDLVVHVCSTVRDLTLVSTRAELDALPDAAHARLAEATIYVVTGLGSDDVPALDLHAKLLAWEAGDIRETLVGSANATGSGWGLSHRTNCEAIVALRPGLRIDQILRAFVSPEPHRLYPWIDVYKRQPLELDDAEKAQKHLDRLQRALAGMRITGSHDAKKEVLTLRALDPPPDLLTNRATSVKAEIVPLLRSVVDSAWAPLDLLFGQGAQFSVGLAELCEFAIIWLRDASHDCNCRFGLQFRLPLRPEDEEARDQAVHAQLLEGLDPRMLLLNVLQGLPAGSKRAGGGHGTPRLPGLPSVLKQATVERVLDACTADPSCIEEIDALLSACRGAPEMASFLEFWAAFRAVVEEETRRA